jgi:hypothetical protein
VLGNALIAVITSHLDLRCDDESPTEACDARPGA